MVVAPHVKAQAGAACQLPPDVGSRLDQEDVSPFEGASMVPLDVTPRPQHTPTHTRSSSGKATTPAKGGLARLLRCCTAPSVQEHAAPEHASNYIRVAEHAAAPAVLSPSIRSQHSWGKAFEKQQQHLQPSFSCASSEYHDARSTCSDITPQHSLERASPAPEYRGVDQQQQQPQQVQVAAAAPQQQELPHWVPQQPLLFAPPGLKFVPVPAVTGFAGVWDLIPERCTPHPQPIDVMTGANAIVRKIHASVPGIVIEEDGRFIKMIANPSFMPKGLPSAHTEVYDKTHETAPAWMPRRDVKLGTGHGYVYYTDDGMLVIRHETWGILGRKPDFIVEDYLTLEEEGTVIVDRMCCQNFKTGARAEQLQVVRLRAAPASE